MPAQIESLMTTRQAARYLNVATAVLSRWCKQGLVPFSRVGKGSHRRFRRDDLDAWLAANSGGPNVAR